MSSFLKREVTTEPYISVLGFPNPHPTAPGAPTAGSYGKPELSTKLGATSAKLNSLIGEVSKTNPSSNPYGEMLGAIQTDPTSPMKTACTSDPMKPIRVGIDFLIERLPGLVIALDEVSKIHPFIAAAVLAFKVVIELEMKRRDNDKKINCLFLQMRDMMEALLRLGTIKDEDIIGRDGVRIEARMQELLNETTNDITECANACDTYSKTKLLVKVLKASMWNSKLQRFIILFEERRREFHWAMALHVSVGMDNVNQKLNTFDDKITLMLEFFVKPASPEEQKFACWVQRKGGAEAVRQNDEVLTELLAASSTTPSSAKQTDRKGASHAAWTAGSDLENLKNELSDDSGTAIRNNLKTFERKFEMQRRELTEEMRWVIHREGDRVLESFTSGPHDKIIDPDIHEIWQDMRWRGNVKARHFVFSLRDFYREKMDEKKRQPVSTENLHIAETDEWALKYINVTRLQPIIEAFDDDASGFITVAEVNQFTTSRPKDWSLLHWLAYWAIGWQMAMVTYAEKINHLFDKMFSLKPLLHPANRPHVDRYLNNVWPLITELTASFRTCTGATDALRARFHSYVDSEEQRLRTGLDAVDYDIDATDTVSLITGPGRIEKSLFPLLYLLLSRDYEIMRACRTTVISQKELWNAADTIRWVFHAVVDRYTDLEDLFKQQKLDATQQFKVFACRIFNFWHDSSKCWTMQRLKEVKWPQHEYDDSVERQDVDISTLLKCRVDSEDIYNVEEDGCRSTVEHLGIVCDSCQKTIRRTRVVCLECDGNDSVDFCDDPTCMSAEIHKDKRDDLKSPHLPTHAVFKLRVNILQYVEYGQNYCAAQNALKKANAAFDDPAEMEAEQAVPVDGEYVGSSSEQGAQLGESETPSADQATLNTLEGSPPRETIQTETASEPDGALNFTTKIVNHRLACVACGEQVTRPCWYCFVCEDDTFICNSCDAKGGVSKGTHQHSHGLVGCQEKAQDTIKEANPVEEKVESLQNKLDMMEDRLLRIEQLLLSSMSVNGIQSEGGGGAQQVV